MYMYVYIYTHIHVHICRRAAGSRRQRRAVAACQQAPLPGEVSIIYNMIYYDILTIIDYAIMI